VRANRQSRAEEKRSSWKEERLLDGWRGRSSDHQTERAQSILVDVSDLTNKSKILIHEREERAKERRKDRDQGNHIQTGITKKINKTKISPLSVPHPSEPSDEGEEIVQSRDGKCCSQWAPHSEEETEERRQRGGDRGEETEERRQRRRRALSHCRLIDLWSRRAEISDEDSD
jgi:hypothetical protein